MRFTLQHNGLSGKTVIFVNDNWTEYVDKKCDTVGYNVETQMCLCHW